MVTVCEALLLALFASVLDVVAVKVAVALVPPVLMLNIELIVTNWPGLSEAMEHGYAVVQAPLFDSNVMPDEVVRATEMPVATDGPLFMIFTLSAKFEPGVELDEPVTVTCTSALWPIAVVALALLLPPFGSAVDDETLALLVTFAGGPDGDVV